ncbi:hypothetical protein BU26DRAFT_57943 [Trematosphaeria pertusa]|uniref:Uncharacterized protein n=1 Tax=Trematosphaeria pertusa TaxID=390896 RepID=A0A6A6I6M6_9PLEO|nr:uncharacterized protein BU26DRAFT_57943 [Trematosphaeria pertusa]KAF2245879.1 hypothetical protein BU26DRAFT_57943 [Trematosphaeria pertusa]
MARRSGGSRCERSVRGKRKARYCTHHRGITRHGDSTPSEIIASAVSISTRDNVARPIASAIVPAVQQASAGRACVVRRRIVGTPRTIASDGARCQDHLIVVRVAAGFVRTAPVRCTVVEAHLERLKLETSSESGNWVLGRKVDWTVWSGVKRTE